MSKLQIPKKIRSEDFKADDRALVDKLAYIINSFLDDTYNILNKGVDYDNLNRDYVSVTVNTDSTGAITSNPQVKVNIKGRVRGISVVNFTNNTNSLVYPTSTPFVSWTLSGANVVVKAVTSLPVSSQVILYMEIIGQTSS